MGFRLVRFGIAAAALAALTASPALAVDYHAWFYSTATNPNPAPLSDCVKRASTALSSQGFSPSQNNRNPVYFDAVNAAGNVNVILWCIGEPKGYDMTLVVMSDDTMRSSFELGRAIYSAFTGLPPPAESTTDISGVWHLTSTCTAFVSGGWQAYLQLNQAANGMLSGTTRSDPLTSVIYAGQSKFSAGTMTMVLAPESWSMPLQLTGQLNGIQITGKVHHLGADDCTFTMTRA